LLPHQGKQWCNAVAAELRITSQWSSCRQNRRDDAF